MENHEIEIDSWCHTSREIKNWKMQRRHASKRTLIKNWGADGAWCNGETLFWIDQWTAIDTWETLVIIRENNELLKYYE